MWVIAIYYYAKANLKKDENKEENVEPIIKPKTIKSKKFQTRKTT